MSKRITIEELQSYLWNSAVLLRTNIDAGAYKQYIFPLLFFKRICDVYDEETALAIEEYGDDAAEFDADEIHTFVVPKGYHWNDVRAVSENVGVAIVEAFRKVENANIDRLQGIFGDGAWTNKNRLPDRLLKDLLEHFSTKTLSIANCPEDELGQGYEYLIKKFADDSGHTAQEFYTNRTVVHLMTEMLKPESGESIYDPTCGSAGMLIHAQQSEGMKTQDVWKKWLELHIPSVESIGGEHSELIDEMQGAINADKLERTVFESIQQKVLGLLSVSGNTEYMHSIANLALLNTADNAALNNSTFDVKRNDIIQMDKKGQYIPFCTKMVFLKYYTPSAENQLHFWGQADRIAYIKAINDVLSDYIEPIVLEKEETK